MPSSLSVAMNYEVTLTDYSNETAQMEIVLGLCYTHVIKTWVCYTRMRTFFLLIS